MHQDIACHHQMALRELTETAFGVVIDGRRIKSGNITHCAKTTIIVDDQREQLLMLLTQFNYNPIILRIPWLQLPDLAVQCASSSITLQSTYCITHCYDAPIIVEVVIENHPEPVYPLKVILF